MWYRFGETEADVLGPFSICSTHEGVGFARIVLLLDTGAYRSGHTLLEC
jgi:hypothetical protein